MYASILIENNIINYNVTVYGIWIWDMVSVR
jgi:hypothetical protein